MRSIQDTRDDTDVNLTIAYFKVDQSNEKTTEVPDFQLQLFFQVYYVNKRLCLN